MQKKTSRKKLLKTPKRYIILDSNVYDFYNHKFLAPQLFTLLQHALSEGSGIAISEISFCEILAGIPFGREKITLQNLNGVRGFPVTKDILIVAAQLACFYKDDGFIVNQISLADQVIAATSFLTNSLVFTCDGRDFPTPFFNVIKKVPLEYIQKGHDVFRYAYFLEPDLDVFSKYLRDREDGGKSRKIAESMRQSRNKP